MDTLIREKLNYYDKEGDISMLFRLDEIPHEEFGSINFQITRKAYMHLNSTRGDKYTCYQRSMAYILDKFHPGITAYIATKAPEKSKFSNSEKFVKLLNGILEQVMNYRISYNQILQSKDKKAHIDAQRMDAAIIRIENIVLSSGYIMAFGSMHGEVYRFKNHDGKMKLTTINDHGGAAPKPLWEKMKFIEWYEENKDNSISSLASNYDILEREARTAMKMPIEGRAKFFGRQQLIKAFQQVDLRDIVNSAFD